MHIKKIYLSLFCMVLLACITESLIGQQKYMLYLKNGSIIKCELINYTPSPSIIIKTAGDLQFEYSYAQIDSLVYLFQSGDETGSKTQLEVKQESGSGHISQPDSGISSESQSGVKQKSGTSSYGIFIGTASLFGKSVNFGDLGFAAGVQFGAGSNPDLKLMFTLGFTSNVIGGSSTTTTFGAIGPRVCLSKERIFGAFLMGGILTGSDPQIAFGFSVDVYLVPKLFVGTRLLRGFDTENSSPTGSLQFVLGYGAR